MEATKERIFKLQGTVQHYVWGGEDYIATLLGIEKENKPNAEYWMGAHPSASSVINIEGKQEPLNRLIEQQPETFIGEDVCRKFGELPYLFKVLDVKDMLSIQVHPTKQEAEKGFEAEEAAGVPIDAPYRNYKDKNHKPEVMVALSEFWLLHGFKTEAEITSTLKQEQEFNFLLPVFKQGSYKELYQTVMELPQQKVDEVLLPLVKRELSKKDDLTKDKPGYWVCKLYKDEQELTNLDKGIFSIYFFNIVSVKPGEAVFQGAGIPHAYLEGQNVELMANSDNVLRGGLTPKHIDVPELIKHTLFEGINPKVMHGEEVSIVERNYPCPVPDFAISLIELKQGNSYSAKSSSAEIYLIVEGAVNVDQHKQYKKGESFYVLPSTKIAFTTEDRAVVYKAFVPN